MSQHKIFWLTGLPCCGKTTIADGLSKRIYSEVIDGDLLRSVVKNNNFSTEFRALNIRYAAEMANRLSNHIDVIVSLISPVRNERDEIKVKYPNVHDIYVKCPLEVCIERDTKGMYAKAMSGEIKDFTGISQAYEEPINPSLVVETDKYGIDECVEKILTLHKTGPKALLIGRWQPLHDGHRWLVEEVQSKGKRVVLGIRDTPDSKDNPYSVQERISMVQKMFGDSVDYIVLPDIDGVYYGRNVGYEIKQLMPPKNIADISAAKIREAE